MSEKKTKIYHYATDNHTDGHCQNNKEHQCCCGHAEPNTAGAVPVSDTYVPGKGTFTYPNGYRYVDEAGTWKWNDFISATKSDVDALAERMDRLEKMHSVHNVPTDDMDDVDEILCDLEEILRTEGNEGYIFTIEALIDAIRSGDEDGSAD